MLVPNKPGWLGWYGALRRCRRGRGFESRTDLNFLGLIFSTTQVVFITAKIAFDLGYELLSRRYCTQFFCRMLLLLFLLSLQRERDKC